MCTPIITAVLTAVSIAMGAASAAMRGKAQKEQYEAAAKAAAQNRKMMREMSADALRRGKEATLRRMQQHRYALARARMRFRGIDTSWGSPLVAFDALDLAAQRDAEMLLENSRRESWEYLERGKGYGLQVEAYKRASSLAGVSAAIGVTSSVVSGLASASQYWNTSSNLADPLVGPSDSGYDYGAYSGLEASPLLDLGYNAAGVV